MVRLLLLVACLVVTGCSSTNNGLRTDTKISVTGVGQTFEEAKNDGFQRAVEFAVGSVMLTETQVKNDNLVKDDIIKHSAGYVDDYQITNKTVRNNQLQLQMVVTVRSSKIAERVLGSSSVSGKVEGDRLNTQISTFVKNKETGDKLLDAVLKDFPKNAFNVEKGNVEYQVTVEREPVVVIPYTVKWNYKYIQALNEVLSIVQDPSSRHIRQETVTITAKDPKAWVLGKSDTYYFNDLHRSQQIKRTFVRPVFVVVTFKDASGNVLISGCDDGHYFQGPNITDPFVLNGNEELDQQMVVTLRSSKEKIKRITSVDISVSTKLCTIID